MQPGSDVITAVYPWLFPRTNQLRNTLWLTAFDSVADELRNRWPGIAVQFSNIQTVADDLAFQQIQTDSQLQLNDHQQQKLQQQQQQQQQQFHVRMFHDPFLAEATEIKKTELYDATNHRLILNEELSQNQNHLIATQKKFAKFEQDRLQSKILDPEDRLILATKNWQSGQRSRFGRMKYLIASGFQNISKPQFDLIAAIAESAEEVCLILGNGETIPDWVDQNDESFDLIECDVNQLAEITQIEAAGDYGEAMQIARYLREKSDTGRNIDPHEIVITTTNIEKLQPYLEETLADCGMSLSQRPKKFAKVYTVAALLRAWRLPFDGFPFPGVGELLRSSLFSPSTSTQRKPWEEVVKDPEIARKTESLLRQLGRPSGKESFLKAIEMWSTTPPMPLDDEAAETPKRQRVEKNANECLPFAKRFFSLWDQQPQQTTLEDWAKLLFNFAKTIFGVNWDFSLDAWFRTIEKTISVFNSNVPGNTNKSSKSTSNRQQSTNASRLRKVYKLEEIVDWLERLASETEFMPVVEMNRSVRLLPPEEARQISCQILVVAGLDEKSFPDTAPESRVGESLRIAARSTFLPDHEERLKRQKILFADLLARPSECLVLSRAAVNEKGNELLPSSFYAQFLKDHQSTLTTNLIRQRIPTEGYAESEAYSFAERRTQAARRIRDHSTLPCTGAGLAADLILNLQRTKLIAEKRLWSKSFSEFDGLLNDPNAILAASQRFAPQKTISPSSLETYIACPFRFWLERVLNIETMTEPIEEIAANRRGQAIHRALRHYHEQEQLGRKVPLSEEIKNAVLEYADRGTDVGRKLWELEGLRLERSARKYEKQWNDYQEEWVEKRNLRPKPRFFEQSFGNPKNPDGINEPLEITIGDVTVKITGTIDRIDVFQSAREIGFWVIDYKTGSGAKYNSINVEKLVNLQLPLYALAVEKTIYSDQPARPYGLAYWMINEKGNVPVLTFEDRTEWHGNPRKWTSLKEKLELKVIEIAKEIRQAKFPLKPLNDLCSGCQFGPTCRITQIRNREKIVKPEEEENLVKKKTEDHIESE